MILEYLWIKELTKIQTIKQDRSVDYDKFSDNKFWIYDATLIEFGSFYQIF